MQCGKIIKKAFIIQSKDLEKMSWSVMCTMYLIRVEMWPIHDCYEKLSGSDPTVHGHFKAVAWNF